jgi:hypothetical protein
MSESFLFSISEFMTRSVFVSVTEEWSKTGNDNVIVESDRLSDSSLFSNSDGLWWSIPNAGDSPGESCLPFSASDFVSWSFIFDPSRKLEFSMDFTSEEFCETELLSSTKDFDSSSVMLSGVFIESSCMHHVSLELDGEGFVNSKGFAEFNGSVIVLSINPHNTAGGFTLSICEGVWAEYSEMGVESRIDEVSVEFDYSGNISESSNLSYSEQEPDSSELLSVLFKDSEYFSSSPGYLHSEQSRESSNFFCQNSMEFEFEDSAGFNLSDFFEPTNRMASEERDANSRKETFFVISVLVLFVVGNGFWIRSMIMERRKHSTIIPESNDLDEDMEL